MELILPGRLHFLSSGWNQPKAKWFTIPFVCMESGYHVGTYNSLIPNSNNLWADYTSHSPSKLSFKKLPESNGQESPIPLTKQCTLKYIGPPSMA